jgi:hypothetical protein
MPAPTCQSCGGFLNKKWGRDAAGNARPRSDWQCPKHGTVLTCAECCSQCPSTGWGGSNLRGKRLTAAVLPAAPAVPVAPSNPAPAAGQPLREAGRSRSPPGLRITPAVLEERMRSQHRFLAGRWEWPLEPSWKYSGRASTWGEAVSHSLTTWWLGLLAAGKVRSVKLQIFLRWVQQQRQEQDQREAHRRQQQHQQQELQQPEHHGLQGRSSSSSSSDRMQFSVPPCVACLESRPTQLCNPCHHLCLCEACSLQLLQEDDLRCPVCRGHVESFTKAWY